MFVAVPRASRLPAADRDRFAREVHEGYRRAERQRLEARDNMRDWDDLADEFRRSSYSQVDQNADKLWKVGLELRRASEGETPREYAFEPDELEALAELEHQRWMVERLLDGWRLGPRDNAKKTHNLLVPWSELGPEEREQDRRPIREMPRRYADLGWEIAKRKP